MKKKLIQILYDMRTQPVVAWVTVIGTALSIFLIMTVMMMQQVKIIPMKPESHRDRMLYGMYIHAENTGDANGSGSANLSYDAAKTLYDGLEGVEAISYVDGNTHQWNIRGTNGKKLAVDTRKTDDGFWKVYDFDLLGGRYFTQSEVEANSHVAIITKSVARKLFDKEQPVGEHIELEYTDYEVIGVVDDVSKLASKAYGEVFVPINIQDVWWGKIFGPFEAHLLVKEGVDFQSIRDEVKRRYAIIDAQIAPDGLKTVYHEAPFDHSTIVNASWFGSNTTPDTTGGRNMRLVIYAILLIVPAINLSTMLQSRLRRRVSELGIRRAFGCTRGRIMSDIIGENLIVTVVGGIIGLAVGILFALFYDGLYTSSEGMAVHPSLSLLLDWHILLSAFGVCFILNIISASVPAWMASRLNPVEAINAR